MKCRLICAMFVGVAYLCGSQAVQAGLVWDAATQFSTTSNTAADTWQYLWAPGAGGDNSSYDLFAYYMNGAANYPVWCNNTQWHFIGKNTSVYDGLVVHPFSYPPLDWPPYIAAIGWKSPIDGVVDTDFSLLDLNAAEGDGQSWYLFKSGATTPLSSGVIDNGGNTGLIHVANVPVAAGDMLYLQIGPRGDFVGDLAGVQFTVTQVPEPGVLALLGCAVFGLLAYAWRKRR
jgi:hypothetical protein